MAASQNGHIDTVKILLEYKADGSLQNQNGDSSLMVASQNGHVDTVKILLEYKADVNLQDNSGAL